MGEERVALEEEQMKADGDLIAYNASRGLSIARKILNEIYGQGITDETITELDLTEIKILYDELVAVVADLDAATADNNQLIKESLSNSRPFDGLYDSLIQALEWMIKQVESGQPLDLSRPPSSALLPERLSPLPFRQWHRYIHSREAQKRSPLHK